MFSWCPIHSFLFRRGHHGCRFHKMLPTYVWEGTRCVPHCVSVVCFLWVWSGICWVTKVYRNISSSHFYRGYPRERVLKNDKDWTGMGNRFGETRHGNGNRKSIWPLQGTARDNPAHIKHGTGTGNKSGQYQSQHGNGRQILPVSSTVQKWQLNLAST